MNPLNEVVGRKPKWLNGALILNFTETFQNTYLLFENASIISEVVLSRGLSLPEMGT